MLPRSARPTCRRTFCMKGISPERPPGRFSSRAHSRNGSSCTRAFSSALLNEIAVFRLEAGHRLEVRAWPREHIARKAVSVVGGHGGRIGDDPSFHGLDHELNVSLGNEVEVPTFPLCQVPPRSGAQEALCIDEQHANPCITPHDRDPECLEGPVRPTACNNSPAQALGPRARPELPEEFPHSLTQHRLRLGSASTALQIDGRSSEGFAPSSPIRHKLPRL